MGVPVPFPQEKLAHLLKNHADVISGLEPSGFKRPPPSFADVVAVARLPLSSRPRNPDSRSTDYRSGWPDRH